MTLSALLVAIDSERHEGNLSSTIRLSCSTSIAINSRCEIGARDAGNGRPVRPRIDLTSLSCVRGLILAVIVPACHATGPVAEPPSPKAARQRTVGEGQSSHTAQAHDGRE